ncbi:MAG: tRNA 2-thiouridine(34) synthase MnmA [Enterobacterales bacterium]|nr:tRNA 2-thiouridine(34) synthase MnmA [Enterobacterales bacterium]
MNHTSQLNNQLKSAFQNIATDAVVVVGLSGGVDSSVAAYLLKRQGFKVIGVFMKNWEEDDTDDYCSAAEDMADAKAVADRLDIPFKTINFAAEYWDNVFEYFLQEYKAGRTPNPDIMCNKEIKFKAFIDYATLLGANYIATGHYARIDRSNPNVVKMLRGLDANKDQSYFLHGLNQQQLSKAIFPVGELEKPLVRAIAEEQGFVTAKKKDSTGICFIGERKFKDFLQTYITAQPGEIEDDQGKVIGRHSGLMYHTLGQRKGIGIGGLPNASDHPWYVVAKDIKRNVLIVGQGHDHPLLQSTELYTSQIDWIASQRPTQAFDCTAKSRYRQTDFECRVYPSNDDVWHVVFEQQQRAVTPGQSIVFYQNEICLGGGIIDRIIQQQAINDQLAIN